MKARDLGGREAILKNARAMCINLGEDEREVVSELRGKQGISEFIRESILLRSPRNLEDGEMRELKEENLRMKTELESYRAKNAKITKEKHDTMAYIAQGYGLYRDSNRRSDDPVARQDWLTSRCKGSGVTATEMTSYLVDQDIR